MTDFDPTDPTPLDTLGQYLLGGQQEGARDPAADPDPDTYPTPEEEWERAVDEAEQAEEDE